MASSPNATLAALACQAKLPLFTQIEGVMTIVTWAIHTQGQLLL